MTNHYEILGLKAGAGHTEIKTAFRRLAKLYHPDKNPDTKEQFGRILKAYEVLSDPVLKSSYDYKLDYHQAQNQPKAAVKNADTKTWRFDDKELKRRQYYNEHYKKNNKTTSQYKEEVENKKSYNEYKYILFATPLAVALFLLIMKLAMPGQPSAYNKKSQTDVAPAAAGEGPQLNMGDMPYAAFFGGTKYDTAFKQSLTVKNMTASDIIVCVFTKEEFIRSFYIKDNYFAEVSQLPYEPLFVRYSSGFNFRHSYKLQDTSVAGAFTKDLRFFKRKAPLLAGNIHELNIEAGSNEFSEIDEKEFFKKINHRHD